MSEIIGEIEGQREIWLSSKEPSYATEILRVGSFYGGKERGRCIQLTIANKHIQLSYAEVEKLQELLYEWL